ncbi:MAG: transglutaminase family protein [Gammaproteobacteria bacterium]|nr:transglutaminase family protein [Gammaproteobacteria bacterium]NIR85910.1 transglutaminase family protein [Gammaproteobacteria bacterium]NIR91902.1 transglutaminase family protein [Gammaproteobacteria bacterium]NIU07159.1 transglutaminase family protein [Gammaproteobacteria bacterium]NIV53972.1 hypothetical protein [Gammaproteobacteria bacterium]
MTNLGIYLAPGKFVDSDHPAVVEYAYRATDGAYGDSDKAIHLYYAVRDDVRYDPYMPWALPESYRASACLLAGRGFCVPKAALLAACGRAVGIPTRVAYADVRNHLCTARLRRLMGTDVFTYHGITELYLDGCWVKVTPTFNIELCEKFGVLPLDFDGQHDALLHPYDKHGRRHMEYLRYHDAWADVPWERISSAMCAAYGTRAGIMPPRADFAAEAEKTDS